MPDSLNRRRPTSSRRRELLVWSSALPSLDSITAVGTLILIVLAALALHDPFVSGSLVLVAVCCLAAYFVAKATNPDAKRQRKLSGLVRRIESGPPGIVDEPLSQDKSAERLLDDLEKRLEQDELCVIRLHGRDILEALPRSTVDAIPLSIECQRIVGMLSWKLEEAQGLDESARRIAAADLRGVACTSLREDESLTRLREQVTRRLQYSRLERRLVPLVDARRDALQSDAGTWLLDLFTRVDCTRGIFIQEPDKPEMPPDDPLLQRGEARDYTSSLLSAWLSQREVDDIFPSLCAAVGGRRGLDQGLLNIRCAVIAAAAELDEDKPVRQLLRPDAASPSTHDDRAMEAALEVRWLVDRKAALICGRRDLTGVFDRLVLFSSISPVTPPMLHELVRDLKIDTEGAGELYDWLRGDRFRFAGIIDSADDGIRLGAIVLKAALSWLEDSQQQAEYEKAKIGRERCYCVSTVLNQAYVARGYEAWVIDTYSGLYRYEIPQWWEDFYTWRRFVEKIDAPEDRRDAGIAITCLFLEIWWWWGDQLRFKRVTDVLDIARKVFRDQPEWIGALEEFDQNYQPEWDLRAEAGERWRHVARALSVLAGILDLQQGEVPPDPVLARIYACWCFFNGDVAQQTGSLESADGWFRDAAQACGDTKDNAAMRAFADYQRADVWIPSDSQRSLRLITETGLTAAATELDDLSLRAYVARMLGDIRWSSDDMGGAFDAYGRALLLSYCYQVDQEVPGMAPSSYSYRLYSEMRTRFLRRLGEAREVGQASQADAAVERVRRLFGPYWELKRETTASSEDSLDGAVPPLPDNEALEFGSGYVKDAQLMLNDKLADQVAEPVDLPLLGPVLEAPEGINTTKSDSGTAVALQPVIEDLFGRSLASDGSSFNVAIPFVRCFRPRPGDPAEWLADGAAKRGPPSGR